MSYEELDQTQDVYFLVSGGRDSTAMVLLAHEQGIKGTLLFGDTRFNLSSARDSLAKLQAYTGYALITARYEGELKAIDVLSESFKKIPQCVEHLERTGDFRRNMFQCCRILKHKPMIEKERELGENAVFLMGLKMESPIHRLAAMNKLRKRNTFYLRHKENGILFYYPLRDMFDSDIEEILKRHKFGKVKSSGCTLCPIFCVFESWRKKDGDSWRRSIQKADRMRIKHPAAGQLFLPQCEGFSLRKSK